MVASGRMGNTMFEFASTYGIARSKGMKLLVPENFYLLKIFKLKVKTTNAIAHTRLTATTEI
jgi:Na+-transporting NADH:ubiquinone oxidoreductase subunit NqrD